MQKLLSGQTRLPSFRKPTSAKERKVPEHWMKVQYRDIANFSGGYGFPENLQGNPSGMIPFIKVSDMNLPGNEKYIETANNYVGEEAVQSKGWKPFPSNSVVFAKVGAALLLNRRRILSKETLLDNNMMAAIPKENVEPYYLYLALLRVDFSRLVQVGALPSINQSQIGTEHLILPPLKEQQAIAEVLSAADGEIEAMEKKLSLWKDQKKFLLNNLVTGTIRLPEFR